MKLVTPEDDEPDEPKPVAQRQTEPNPEDSLPKQEGTANGEYPDVRVLTSAAGETEVLGLNLWCHLQILTGFGTCPVKQVLCWPRPAGSSSAPRAHALHSCHLKDHYTLLLVSWVQPLSSHCWEYDRSTKLCSSFDSQHLALPALDISGRMGQENASLLSTRNFHCTSQCL